MYTKENLTPEVVSQLKATHGQELRAVETAMGIVVFRKPTRQEWDMYQDKKLASAEDGARTARELCQACLAGCSYEDMMAALNDRPGLLQGEFMIAMLQMAGAAAGSELPVKKL